MKEKLYYLKWDIDNESFLLDVSYRANDFVYGIKKVMVTEVQANEFSELIEIKYKGKSVNLTFLEYEFDKFFHICKDCGKATSHVSWVKRQKDRCYDCYQATLSEVRKEAYKETVERGRVKRMQSYIKTDQGKADITGSKAIKDNVIVQLKKHNKTQKELAEVLQIAEESVNRMLKEGLTIRLEYLYKIAEWLFVPIDLLLKAPRGAAPLKRKNNIPIMIYRKPMKTIK